MTCCATFCVTDDIGVVWTAVYSEKTGATVFVGGDGVVGTPSGETKHCDSGVEFTIAPDGCSAQLALWPATNKITDSSGSTSMGGVCAEHNVTCGEDTDYVNVTDGGFINTISGGGGNHITGGGAANIINGGAHNVVGASAFEVWHGTIAGGSCNRISAPTERSDYSVISGGSQNTIEDSDFAGIFSSFSSFVGKMAQGAGVVFGRRNRIGGAGVLATDSAIVGGDGNEIAQTARAIYSAIVGGQNSQNNHDRSVILGGQGLVSVKANATHVDNIHIANCPVFADDAAAAIPSGCVYQTPTGDLKIKQ